MRIVNRQSQIANRKLGFTLIEILLALSLLSVISVVTYLTFNTSLRAWKKGTSMTDNLHHGDYVVEQLEMALRSMYYPESRPGNMYGFWHEDNGSDESASDVISWVKLGTSLVGADCSFVDSPHRVKFYLDTDDEGRSVVTVKAWQLLGQPEEFDPEEDVEAFHLSRKVIGFDCRAAYRIMDDEIDWSDEWEETNRIPTVVEITLYLEPAEEGGEPALMTRIIGIPVGPRTRGVK